MYFPGAPKLILGVFFTERRDRYACPEQRCLLLLGQKSSLCDRPCGATQNSCGCVSSTHLSPGPPGWRWGEGISSGGDLPSFPHSSQTLFSPLSDSVSLMTFVFRQTWTSARFLLLGGGGETIPKTRNQEGCGYLLKTARGKVTGKTNK